MPDPRGTIRLPFAPLEALHDGTRSALAELLGVHTRQLYRWLAEGITPWRADDCAARLHSHPLEVWGDAWEEAIDNAPPSEPLSPRRYSILSRQRATARGVPVNGVLPDRAKRCPEPARDRIALTVQEVADVFDISYERVRRAVHRGEIPGSTDFGRVWIPRLWLEGNWPPKERSNA